MRAFLQILGMVLLVLGAQGVIRIVLFADDGLFAWVPGGYPSQLVVSAIALVAGVMLLKGAADERAAA